MGRIDRRGFLSTSAAAIAGTWFERTAFAGIRDPNGEYAGAVFQAGAPPLPEPGGFTIAVLPDTQHYSQCYPEQFLAQTRWIASQHKIRNIACVLHLGDLTNLNTPAEWGVARQAMCQLDGLVPYFMTLGNHDYSDFGECRDRTTLFNDYFPVADYRDRPHFGGVYDREPDRLKNSFHFFSAGGRGYLVLCLEFGPRADVVRWANQVVAKHPDLAAILVTHAYTYSDESRYDWKRYQDRQQWNPHTYGVAHATNQDVCDGEELWEQLVSRHPNFVMTLNGHVLNDGLAHVSTATPSGRRIPQVLVNFQMKPNGGDGWLRLLEFRLNGRTVQTYDYSPSLNLCNNSRQNRFAMSIPG